MKRLFAIDVEGKHKSWSFNFEADEKYLKDWTDDGLPISLVLNIIPVWIVDMGLTKIWVFLQDIFQFR